MQAEVDSAICGMGSRKNFQCSQQYEVEQRPLPPEPIFQANKLLAPRYSVGLQKIVGIAWIPSSNEAEYRIADLKGPLRVFRASIGIGGSVLRLPALVPKLGPLSRTEYPAGTEA